MPLHRNVRVRIGLAFVHKLIDAMILTFIASYLAAPGGIAPPPEDRKYVYTVNYWVINLALGGGALLGGFLYGSHFGAVILGGAIGMAFALLVTVVLVAETKPGPTTESTVAAAPAKLRGWAQF